MSGQRDGAAFTAVFDVDGTLVDGEHNIQDSMAEAFERAGSPPPERAAVRRIIGLSLLEAVARLAPAASVDGHERLAELYCEAFIRRRQAADFREPLFDGARAALAALRERGWRLAVATGKSRKGVDAMLARHGLDGWFDSVQCADGNPGKPHPAMVQRAIAETGSCPATTAMIGDTSYDMQMARGAGCAALGVSWGCHAPDELREAGALRVVETFGELLAALDGLRAR